MRRWLTARLRQAPGTVLSDELIARVRQLVAEGNVRRIIVKQDGRTVLEIPLTLGVVGTVLAPQVAVLGALGALVTRCTLTVERENSTPRGPDTASGGELPPDSPPGGPAGTSEGR